MQTVMIAFIAVLLIVVVTLLRRREMMTNKDVVTALQKYTNPDVVKSEKIGETQQQIYGPSSGGIAKEATPSSSSSKNKDGGGEYPQIYGPDTVVIPGTKPSKKATESSDEVSGGDDTVYQFNPDLQKAFPVEGPPQPFLADFSAFQR
jgi:hypothetical protein